MSTEAPAHEQLDFRTLCDAVFLKLRDEIINGTLGPGQKLEQRELADRFGISRMPVRDALHRLEAEGLVVVHARRGAVVPDIDLQELQEIYEIREALQSLAARLAAPNFTDQDLELLTRLEEQMEEASRRGEASLWVQLDAKFHQTILQRCNRPRLMKVIRSFWNTTHHFRRAYVLVPGATARGETMHRQMLEVIRARDSEQLAALISQHLWETVRSIREAHQRIPSESPEAEATRAP